jgi:hypothetical protein
MKQILKLFTVVIIMAVFSIEAFSQVTASATATATIISPIAIAKTVDMNFGNVAVGAVAGTVVLSPAGVRTPGGGVTLPATTGTVAAASFDVTGQSGFTYSITLPAAATTISFGANTMTVDTWTSSPTPTGTLTGGAETLTVGATLHVGASQAPGTYVSGTPFDVTVNYN